MSNNIKRIAWLTCRNMFILVVAIAITAIVILGMLYVLGEMFGPMGLTLLMPIGTLIFVSLIVAISQVKHEQQYHDVKFNKKHRCAPLTKTENTDNTTTTQQ